jgi:hypothetical protein
MSGEMTINQKDIDQVYQWLYKDTEPGEYHQKLLDCKALKEMLRISHLKMIPNIIVLL